jgi:predicted permease
MAATLIAGLWPARAASRPDLVPALKGAVIAGRKFGLRGVLVVAQLSLSMVGITATLMLTRGIFDLKPFDPGVDPHKVLTASMWPAMSGYSDARASDFRRELAARMAKQPGVEAATVAALSPGVGSSTQKVMHTGSPLLPKQESVMVRSNQVGPGFFETLNIRIRRGRAYTEADMSGRPLCLVNETMARRFWPGQEPLGQTVRVSTPRGETAYEVIGVARDTAYEFSGNEYAPFLYTPVNKTGFATLIVRTGGKATALGEQVRRTVAALDPDMPVLRLEALGDVLIGGSAGTELRLRAGMFGTLAGTALLLSALGLYGVISYLVSRRTREIGIRLALGAGRVDVLRAVIADGAKLVAAGIAVGIGLSMIVTPLLTTHVFGVKPNQPGTIAASCALLAAVAAIAMLAPARKACKVQAVTALRYH